MTVLPPFAAFLSPPELPSLDAFPTSARDAATSHERSPRMKHLAVQSKMRPSEGPLSPPASPWTVADESQPTLVADPSQSVQGSFKDPPLYVDDQVASGPQQPLFQSYEEQYTAQKAVDQYIARRNLGSSPSSNATAPAPASSVPSRDEYLLALACVPKVTRSYNEDRGNYLRRTHQESEKHLLAARHPDRIWSRHVDHAAHSHPIWSHPKTPRVKVRPVVSISEDRRGVQSKPPPKPMPASSPTAATKASINVRRERPIVPHHTRAPSIKRPEDVHFEQLPDFSPPLSTLPDHPKALKIEWPSSHALDLSADPNRHLLHDAELQLASTLRLSCATYLCSKRRIFLRVIEAYRIGKEFRKTDAQQACQIDVNKASKLWTAYDRVGWFDPRHFTQRLSAAH